MINIHDKKNCCGCNACGDVCPKGAIRFETDDEEFLYPVIDKSLCINCGLCDKVCPQTNVEKLRQELKEPECWAAAHRNNYIRFDSTSGGAFSAFANVIYGEHGFVGGALYNEEKLLVQFISDNPQDLERLRSSKYSQSNAQGFYKAVKEAVLTGRPVLVCGTPCQMVALRAFLGKDYSNLFIIDFICRGLNSPLPGRAFIKWQEEREGSPVVYGKSKNKELGWHKLTLKIVHKNGKITYWTRDNSPMTHCYLKTNAFCRPSCYECKVKGTPRFADVSVADCWGAEKLFKGPLAQDIGTSLIMLNNAKGRQLFEKAKPYMHCQEMPWDVVHSGNGMIDNSLPPSKYPRDEVFAIIREKGFQGLMDKFVLPDWEARNKPTFKQKIKAIIRRWRQLFHLARSKECNTAWLLLRWLHDNGLANLLKGRPLIMATRTNAYIENHGSISLGGDLQFGGGTIRHVPVGSIIQIKKGGRLTTKGNIGMMYGACVEVHEGGELTIGDKFGANMGLTIICGGKITIGEDVMCGRHVTLRNSNGNHPMNIPGAKNSRPLIIGDHVWFCENSTVMNGVKIGSGAVIGSYAVVYDNVPANTLVMGNPAKVVMENVQWKR